MHKFTGDVYIGGVNQLYRLTENLELLVNITTGPDYDEEDKAHDTFNKILTFNYADNDLITCGGYRGVCEIRDVVHLYVTYSGDAMVSVAANTSDESTVGYIAPHYHLGQPLLYVGTTSTSQNPGNPFVSGRQLEGNQVFEVIEDSNGNTRVDVDITLTTIYSIRPAQDLSQSLALDDDEEVLFIAFAEGVNNPPISTAKSAICMYKMSVIERAFQDAAEGCMEGYGLPEYTASWMQGASCASALPYSRGIHECYAATNYQYANGVDDQHGYDVEDYTDTLVTSIAVTTVQQHTVGFLGTDTGTILKVHFTNDTNANTYEVIEI
ncbi:plexin-A4-like [Ptychodera flava]|uniref:plexin-A4-like n=1 Tax=Ptychodera flava TaxID=63121 RepID=UPI00396A8947